MTVPFDPIVNDGLLYVNNMQVAYASATTLTIAAGQCRDSTNSVDMVLSSPVTINGAINGLNGLDTGSLANNTWYYVYVISDSANFNPTGGLISTSASAPVMPDGQFPSNYSAMRMLGAVLTNGSAQFLEFRALGNGNVRQMVWDAGIQVLNAGNSASAVAVSCATAIPPIENTMALLQVNFTPATAGDYVSVRPTGSSATLVPQLSGVVASQAQRGQLQVLTRLASGVAKFDYINSAASCASTIYVQAFTMYI